ncbi:MAG: SEC-C domain-containing protein, partial [Clostridia bacterium]|nr:SEC-C domain-containing protein [Clostridia bacterium]
QRSPITEYKIAGADLFDEMVLSIRDDTVRQILSANQVKKREQYAKASSEGFAGGAQGQQKSQAPAQKPVRVEKVGRNDPCPCGSGKKYKKCCGASQGEE